MLRLPSSFLAAACALLLGSFAWSSLARAGEPRIEKTPLFTAGQIGYKLFRIPGIVVSQRGVVLAYCEARRFSGSDWDTIDILLRRSVDAGQTWLEPQKIAHLGPRVPRNAAALAKNVAKPDDQTTNNPVAFADRDGTVHFLYCCEYARCFYMRSADDGATWSTPVDITSAFERLRSQYDWKVIATGPGHGIQLRNGRLLVPIWISTGTGGNAHRPSVTATIYSDDQGRTWQTGDIAVPDNGEFIVPNETTAVELADGRVMLNVRSESKPNRRIVTTSPDGATDWARPVFVPQLLEPICEASLARLSLSPPSDRNRLLFSNPNTLDPIPGKEALPGKSRMRKNLCVKLSYDEGASWPVNQPLETGFSGYSDLAAGPDGSIYCLYEAGSNDGKNIYSTASLTLARFNLEWLTDGHDSLSKAKE